MNAQQFMERLWQQHNKKFTVLVGGGFGDPGKGTIESALIAQFETVVRITGGANTGRTCIINTPGGPKKFVFHLIPCGWAYGKEAIIGDWVLLDLPRFIKEYTDVINIVGKSLAPLYISNKAPLCLVYHQWLETWIEFMKGAGKIGSTGRGIGQAIACVDLRINPLAGNLSNPDKLFKMVKEVHSVLFPIFKEMAATGLINLADGDPKKVTEGLLADGEKIKHLLTDTGPILHDYAKKNQPTLFTTTQGFGLTFNGTYPFIASTQTTAPAAAYCGGLPMACFGPVIQVEKLFGTRVGKGPFPTGLWNRQAAEDFALDQRQLFVASPERTKFLQEKLEKINQGEASREELAQYIMVLADERGASTGRGREVGLLDCHLIASGAMVNGADCIALTHLDSLSGLKMRLPFGIRYLLDNNQVPLPVIPTPVELMEKVEVEYGYHDLDLQNQDLSGLNDFDDLPLSVKGLITNLEQHIGVPIGIISTSASPEGKIYCEV